MQIISLGVCLVGVGLIWLEACFCCEAELMNFVLYSMSEELYTLLQWESAVRTLADLYGKDFNDQFHITSK
jgi:hypothetical protein